MTASTEPVLYHAPFACSFAVKLAAQWGGLNLDTVTLDLSSKQLRDGSDYRDIHATGQVSALRWLDGTLLTETSACLAWVQSKTDPLPDAELFQMLRWLGFCTTELHKQGLRVIFYDEATDAVKAKFRALTEDRLAYLATHLENRTYLLGDKRTAADAYLTWFLTLSDRAGIDTDAIAPYRDRMLSDKTVQACLADDARLKADLMETLS